MDGMTNALANGHRSEDSIMSAVSPSLQVQRLVPLPAPEMTAEDTTDTGRAEGWRHAMSAVSAHRAWLAAVPIVLVNSVAFAGQLAFLRGHLPWPLAGQVLVAVTLESVSVYLAWQAHLALAADDSAMRLRMAAYGFAAVIGACNYSHYMAPHWRPTFAAVTFGLMSVSSPWLWSVHSRRASRDALLALNKIEPHAVRLGATRWTWHPVRSTKVMFHATWAGENDPVKAIALVAAADAPADVPGDTADVAPHEDKAEDMSADNPEDTPCDNDSGIPEDKPEPCPAYKPTPRRPAPARTGHARATDIIKRNPGLDNATVAKRANVSTKTVQRARADLAKASQ